MAWHGFIIVSATKELNSCQAHHHAKKLLPTRLHALSLSLSLPLLSPLPEHCAEQVLKLEYARWQKAEAKKNRKKAGKKRERMKESQATQVQGVGGGERATRRNESNMMISWVPSSRMRRQNSQTIKSRSAVDSFSFLSPSMRIESPQ